MTRSIVSAGFTRLLLMTVAFVLSFTGAAEVHAELATSAEMSQVCDNWLTQITYARGDWAGVTDAVVRQAHDITVGDTLLARYYDISPKGFVLVSALKEMTPVKAYSDRFNLDEAQENGFLAMVTESFVERTRLYVKMFGSLEAVQPDAGPALFGRGQKKEWTRLTLPQREFQTDLASSAARSTRDGGPLCTTSWDQGDPYNNFCPQGQNGTSVVGCVATAAAQVMAYWQWPEWGFGSHTYLWDGDQSCGGDYGGGYLTADFSDPYDWTNMVDSCSVGCTPAQQDAVAELCYEVGVAFEMDYSSCGSGAYTARALTVYPEWFKYSPNIRRVNRADHTLQEYFNLVKNEIDSNRVIQYRIRSHSIVLDGYRELYPGYYEYHMNYGWANSFNAWYVFDSLYCGWVDGDICPADEEYMITHIYPQTEPVLAKYGEGLVEAVGNGNGHANAGESMDLTVQVINRGWDAVNPMVTLSTTDPYITIGSSTAGLGSTLVWGQVGATDSPLQFTVGAGCPDPYVATLHVTMAAEGGYLFDDSLQVFVGDTPGLAADFEIDDGLWWHRAETPNFGDQWHRETYRAYSGSVSWKVGGAGANGYGNSLDAALTTPPFLLPENAVLSFQHWRNIEAPGDPWDGGIVMISIDGGVWEQIHPEGGYPDTLIDNSANALPGATPCYSGNSDWTEAVFDLGTYSGVAQIMFRFASDASVTYEGWYVDDVEVLYGGCCLGIRGNVNGDLSDETTVADLTSLISFLFRSGVEPPCMEEADIDGDGALKVSDLTALINYLFRSGPAPAPC